MRWKPLLLGLGVPLWLGAQPGWGGELRPFAPPPPAQQPAPRPDPFREFRQQAARLTPEERRDLAARLAERLKQAKEQGNEEAAYRYYRFLRILEEQP
ncbi:hypothetical protein [Deferrisoma camini]|uniref:hypothetical protein n=1 Tax=Deferrisoma camini TaxID=1035120 RepID=UPI00046C9EC2|nr:hypothetical protein [Deferrisoma camini]